MAFVRTPLAASSIEEACRTFAAQRCVWLRGALETATIDAVTQGGLRVAEERERVAEEQLSVRARRGRQRGFVRLDDIELGFPLLALIPEAAYAIAGEYLGEGALLAEERSFRIVDASRPAGHLGFHRDEDLLEQRVLNVWIALAACGTDAPGLEVVVGSERAAFDPVGDPAADRKAERHRLDERDVIAACGRDAVFCPAFERGDAMIFSGATVHRTCLRPEMTQRRLSLELRLVAPAV